MEKRKVARRSAKKKSAEPRAAPKKSSHLGTVLTIVGVVVAFAAGALLVVYPTRPLPGTGRFIAVTLSGKETPDMLADELARAGVIDHPEVFAAFVKLHGASGKIAAGTHLFADSLSPSEALARAMRFGAGPRTKVTIPEGWTRFDIAKRLENKGVCTTRNFLDASESAPLLQTLRLEAPSFEGFLFPATYDFPEDSAPESIVTEMKLAFDKRYGSLEDRNQAGVLDLTESLHFTERDIVTLASMVEKEAAVDDERPIIASVFLNRLRDPKFSPKLLQCDPTAGYGCLVMNPPPISCASFNGKITHEIVADPDNLYNTYKHEGLPPGPIANPGAKSIEAVMAPSSTHYFYFVAKGGGRHTFSETYAGHTAAIHDAGAGANAGLDAAAGLE